MIVKTNRELKKLYHKLGPGDIFIGTITSKHMKQSMLIDLIERGIHCFPSPLSQILNGSKTAQVLALQKWMLPHTFAITRRVDLVDVINQYDQYGIGPVVTKEDKMHCGHGVRKWDTTESLYSVMALSKSSYPFVVQPFLENFTDVRVIIVGDCIKAYMRHNPYNFRMNISSGGKSYPFNLDSNKKKLCRDIMERGKFPYAHIDFQITESEKCYLSEIALNGGIKGTDVSRRELDQKKEELLECLADDIQETEVGGKK